MLPISNDDADSYTSAMRDMFLRLMPIVADEPGAASSADELSRRTGEAIEALVAAYTDFSNDDSSVEKARHLCASIDRFSHRLDDDPRWIGRVIDPVLLDMRWARGRTPRPGRQTLWTIAHQAHLRARRLAGGEARPVEAHAAMERGDAPAAVDARCAYTAEHPDDLRSWFALAHARAAAGDTEGARAAYRRVIALADLPAAHYNLGLASWRENKLEEALVEFRATRGLTPENAEAWHNEALVLRQLGRPGEARDIFVRARRTYEERLQDDPEDATTLLWLAGVTAALGEGDVASAILTKALAARPDLRAAAANDPDLAALLPQTAGE